MIVLIAAVPQSVYDGTHKVNIRGVLDAFGIPYSRRVDIVMRDSAPGSRDGIEGETLRLFFDDVILEGFGKLPFSRIQGRVAAAFIRRMHRHHDPTALVVSCGGCGKTAGISRAGALAITAGGIVGIPPETIQKWNPGISPNIQVTVMMQAMAEESGR